MRLALVLELVEVEPIQTLSGVSQSWVLANGKWPGNAIVGLEGSQSPVST